MNEGNESVIINSDDKNIVIVIPIDTLVFAQENRPDLSYKITNVEKMVKYFKDRFLDFGTDDMADSHLYQTIDNFFSDAAEYGEEWIESTEFED
jgi:hypothetical protein